MNYEIDITRRCTVGCPGCNHLCNILSDPTSDMTLEDVESIVSQINELDRDPRIVAIVGGEPTLHPRCVEFCAYIKEHIRGFSQLRLNTNYAAPDVVSGIKALGYSVADYQGEDHATVLRVKASTHYNALLSPRDEGMPIRDPHTCYVLRGLGGSGPCGICVHKYKGALRWCYCAAATSICKLLGREDEFMFPTLRDLFMSSIDKLCSEVCVHCMAIAKHPILARDSVGKVSPSFRHGLEAIREYGISVGGLKRPTQATPAVPPSRSGSATQVEAGSRRPGNIIQQRGGRQSKGLADLANSLDLPGYSMVEVGSYAGASTDIFAACTKTRDIWAVDPWRPGYDPNDVTSGTDFSAAEAEFDAVAARHADKIRKFRGDLRGFIAANPGFVPDFVYIDAMHTYEACKDDILTALQWLGRGLKFIGGHDYNTSSWKGVVQAVDEIFGKPDRVFDDTSWLIDLRGRHRPAYGQSSHGAAGSDVSSAMRDKLDCVLLLTCPQGVGTRLPASMAEFSRLGIGGMVMPYLNEHNAFGHAELDRRRFANEGAARTNVKNCLLGHYGMVKFALDAGFGRVMFVEDDCRFVESVDRVAAYFAAMPDGVNATIDYSGVSQSVVSSLFVGDDAPLWAVLPGGLFFDNLTCYILNRSGMSRVVEYFERCGTADYKWPVDAADRLWPYLTAAVPVYIPRTRFAVQRGSDSLIRGTEV